MDGQGLPAHTEAGREVWTGPLIRNLGRGESLPLQEAAPRLQCAGDIMSLGNEHDLSLAATSSTPCQRRHLLSIPEGLPAKGLVTRGQGLVAFLPRHQPHSAFQPPLGVASVFTGESIGWPSSTPPLPPTQLSAPLGVSPGAPNHAVQPP